MFVQRLTRQVDYPILEDMKITTRKYSVPANKTVLDVDCEHSSAVQRVVLYITPDEDDMTALVTYRSGSSWFYHLPLTVGLLGLSEASVGRFVATVLKTNATSSKEMELV